MKRPVLNPWAIATLACVCFVFIAADSVGPNVPSLFSRVIATNKTADAWRSALSVPSATSLTAVSNAQVTTAGNLLSVSNAQVTTAGNLVTVSNAQVATAANLVAVSNAQVTTAGNLVTVSNAQVATAANLVTVSNAQVATAANLVAVSNAQVTTAGNLTTVSNAQVTTDGNLTTVSNAQVATAANLLTVSNAHVATAGNLLSVSNAQVTTAGNLVTVSNAQVATAANLVTVSNAQVATAGNLTTVSNAQVTTAANLVTVSNAQVTTDGKLAGYVTNLGGLATNAALTGGTVTGQTNLDLTASRVMVSDANGRPASSSVTPTTLAFLDATSSVQAQLDSKPTVALTNLALLNGTNVFTGTNTFSTNLFVGPVNFQPGSRYLFYTNFATPLVISPNTNAGAITTSNNIDNFSFILSNATALAVLYTNSTISAAIRVRRVSTSGTGIITYFGLWLNGTNWLYGYGGNFSAGSTGSAAAAPYQAAIQMDGDSGYPYFLNASGSTYNWGKSMGGSGNPFPAIPFGFTTNWNFSIAVGRNGFDSESAELTVERVIIQETFR